MFFTSNNNNQLSNSDIRTDDLYEEWKKMLESEVNDLSNESDSLELVDCPGCTSNKKESLFKKFGMNYHRCNDCGSIFVSPRPSQRRLSEFYNNSKAVKFWKDKMISNTLEKRKKHELVPLKKWFKEVVQAYKPNAKVVVDYKPKFYSPFSFDNDFNLNKVYFIEPLHMDDVLGDHISVTNDLGSIEEDPDVVVAFNVLDREVSPNKLINKISEKLKPGALLFLTANTSSGLEYQVLGENSSRLVPPDRLNLLSVEAIEKILSDAGFEVLDISTPGKLDMEIIAKESNKNSDLAIPDFLKYIINHRDESALKSLQNFLQLNNLSSFLRAVAIKK